MLTEDLPDHLNRLETLLLAIDDDEAMLLGELDGFICGVMVAPEIILPDEWLPATFADVLPEALAAAGDIAEFNALMLERYAEMAAELSVDRYQPLYEVDTDGSMMWEFWLQGFERAMGLRLKAWERLLQSHKESIAQEAMSTSWRCSTLSMPSRLSTIPYLCPLLPMRPISFPRWQASFFVQITSESRLCRVARSPLAAMILARAAPA